MVSNPCEREELEYQLASEELQKLIDHVISTPASPLESGIPVEIPNGDKLLEAKKRMDQAKQALEKCQKTKSAS